MYDVSSMCIATDFEGCITYIIDSLLTKTARGTQMHYNAQESFSFVHSACRDNVFLARAPPQGLFILDTCVPVITSVGCFFCVRCTGATIAKRRARVVGAQPSRDMALAKVGVHTNNVLPRTALLWQRISLS